jgi:antitoxin YefM
VSISANEARQRFYPLIRQVNEDHEPVEVVSREHGDVVIMSAEDFRSWQETVYLLRSPANAQRLMEAVARDKAGEPSINKTMDELEAMAAEDSAA